MLKVAQKYFKHYARYLSPLQSILFVVDGQFLIKTSGRNDHNTVWLTAPRSFISFSVEACAEAHISLAETPGVLGDAAYEVILGADSNTKSRILKDMNSQQIVDEEDTPEILNCNGYKVEIQLNTTFLPVFLQNNPNSWLLF